MLSLSLHLLLQALVKVPLRRPHLADSLKTPRTDRQGFVDLAAFLGWLWKLTVVPERYCRDMCMWLMDKLATLQMEDAMQTGHPILTYIPKSLAQLLGHSLACLLTHESHSHPHSLTCSFTHSPLTHQLTLVPLTDATCLFAYQPCYNSAHSVLYCCCQHCGMLQAMLCWWPFMRNVQQGLTVKAAHYVYIAVGCSSV